jgi:hypothetical protein
MTIADDLLKQVEKSPAAVAIHDKAAWMSIFAQYHIVEDPVGSTPHVGGVFDAVSSSREHGALSRFFDTFIAPNNIVFDVKNDLVCGNHVLRDLSINLQMSAKVQATVPMHLLYELQQENGEWKIVRLAAHWELIPMVLQLLKKGLPALPVLAGLSWRMLKLQGVMGMLGFAKAAFTVGKQGKQLAQDFAAVQQSRSLSVLMNLFDGDRACIYLPYGTEAISPSNFFEQQNIALTLSKVIAAGDTVTASIKIAQVGEDAALAQEGVALFEFNRKTKKISSLRLYY